MSTRKLTILGGIGDYPAMTHDAETIRCFTAYNFRNLLTDELEQFTTWPGVGRSFAELREWWRHNKHSYVFIGFNSSEFDNHILQAILNGQDDPAVLYEIGQLAIQANNGGDFPRATCFRATDEINIDLRAISGRRIGSLKEIGVRLGYWRLQEMPIPHDLDTITPTQINTVMDYNTCDLEITAAAALILEGDILSRLALLQETGVDVTNDSDPKLAERIMAQVLFNGGRRDYPTNTTWHLTGDELVQGHEYIAPELQEMRERLRQTALTFRLHETIEADGGRTKEIIGDRYDDAVTVNGKSYTIGIGGLHSIDTPMLYEATPAYEYDECDVSGCYPAIICHNGWAPRHLPRRQFSGGLDNLRQRRAVAKATAKVTGNRNDLAISDGLKIATNALFGKSGSAYCYLCDPTFMYKTTIGGQLILLKIIDMIAQFGDCTVISANTDGLCFKRPAHRKDEIRASINAFAAGIGLNMDWTTYRLIARRDVSSYFAVTTEGKAVGKGAYGYNAEKLNSKATQRVVIDAVQQYFAHGAPVEDTIRACTDIRQFINYFRCDGKHHLQGDDGVNYGRLARWYIATEGHGCRLDVANNTDPSKTSKKVERGAVVLADLPEQFPDDVDTEFYIALSHKLVRDILEPEHKEKTAIPLQDLSNAQRAQFDINRTVTTADPDRCDAIDLRSAHDYYAALVQGNRNSTMYHALLREWRRGRGTLTYGDLLWIGEQINEHAGDGYFSGRGRRNLTNMVGSITRKISPFPLPRTTKEHIARAITWAQEHVEPLKRKRKNLTHREVEDSDYVSGVALRKYGKTGNEYPLACAIAAIFVKHAIELDPTFIGHIMADVRTYFSTGNHDEPV